jgi:hypothetical protein
MQIQYADPNRLTLYHDEVNNAANSGSNWVAALALSSAIEGLCKGHPAWVVTPSPVSSDERASALLLVRDIGDEFLRQRLQSALENACRDQPPAVSPVLRSLIQNKVIEAKHKKAWEELRHFVIHGNLLDHRGPDKRLDFFSDLLELLHLLTASLIGFRKDDVPLSPQTMAMLEAWKKAQ